MSLTLLAMPAHADGVVATLSVQALVPQPDGRMAARPAPQARPGDLLEYQVVYRNTSALLARRVEGTLPIPVGTVYEPGSGQRMAPMASTDGRRFEPTPLLRRVSLPDGRVEQQPVPLAEYRFVRWPIGELTRGQAVTVSARARVIVAAPLAELPPTGAGRRP